MEKHGILVHLQKAETALRLLRSLQLLDTEHQPLRKEDSIILPLARELSEIEASRIAKRLGQVIPTVTVFREARSRPKNLRDALRGRMPAELLEKVPRSLDVIGDISVVELPEELKAFSSEIGQGILNVNPQVRLVLQKCSDTSGTFRTRKFEVIAGRGGTETVYQEFSCRYHLDVSTVYFNPRLSHERMRVARQVNRGESVVDMFAGVGPYSILIANLQRHSTVYSVDINPEAIKYLKENAFINQVADRVIPMFGDVRELDQEGLQGVADRIIMNYPSGAMNYMHAACNILSASGGVIHFYAFVSREKGTEATRKLFESTVKAQNRRVESFNLCRILKEIAPSRVQVAIDALVR